MGGKMENKINYALTEKLAKAYIGGHSNLKVDMSATPMKIFIDRMKGARVYDLDGNEYVDYMCALGPIIVGHCHEQYVAALKESIDTMSPTIGSYVLATEKEIELADKLKKHIPCAEEIKFAVTGSEAVQLAFRLARAYTGKRYVIRFADHYHGWFDNVLGQVMNPDATGMPFGIESDEDMALTAGKDPEAVKQTFILPWNDIDAVKDCLKLYGDQVAMVHCEPIVFNHQGLMPKPGFFEALKAVCEEYNVVLSFDEVITGFRCGLGGAQAMLGVTPHMATYGKAMAGGMPVSLVAGKKDIMGLLEDRTVLGPGTFMGYPLGVAASLATIKILEADNGAVYREMDRLQERLSAGIMDTCRKKGLPMLCQGTTGAMVILPGVECDVAYTNEDLETLDIDMLFNIWATLQEEGVITRIGGTFYMTTAHNDADIDFTLEAFSRCMARL
jgi:glutamate-1-semialdehyde 2,1-aminomutase